MTRQKILFTMLMLCCFTQGFSMCTNGYISIWPYTDTLTVSPVLVLEGFASSQGLIEGLGADTQPYLKSESHTVSLEVKERLTSWYSKTQAVLQPTEPLHPGETYRLIISDIPNSQQKWFDRARHGKEPVYTVVADYATPLPPNLKPPAFLGALNTPMGCGDELYAEFEFPFDPSQDFLVETILINQETKERQRYYLYNFMEPRGLVGHEMCGGEFVFAEGANYAVQFILVDRVGKRRIGTIEPIVFESPGASPFPYNRDPSINAIEFKVPVPLPD